MSLNEANWLLYIHINKREQSHASKAFRRIQSNLSVGTSVYVIHFGPSLLSDAVLYKISRNEMITLLKLKNKTFEDVPLNLKILSDHILKSGVQIDALCMMCHGASYGMGKWKTWRRPFLQIDDAVKYLVRPFKMPLICFDSCFQGNMSCLYELPTDVKVVLASPAFHPYASISWTRAFGRLQRGSNKIDLLRYGHEICCEWNDLSKARWKGLLVFDMAYIPKIANMVRESFDLLRFDRISQIDNEDANLHDLFAAARHVPKLQFEIIQSTSSTPCGKCSNACSKRIRGMSMESHLPRKWITAFSSTKWYKEIVGSKRGFENEKLNKMFADGKI